MTGLEEFLSLFGNITVNNIVIFILSIIFCFGIYKQIKKFFDNKKDLLIQKHELDKKKDEDLSFVLSEVKKYPEYREQSRKIQQSFRKEIDGLKESQIALVETQQNICETLKNMQEKQERRDRNKLRDRLLQSYRYYTDKDRNPSQSWSKMESEAFWELFHDYEEAGGDGYMHTVIQPAMNLLKIVENF